MLRSESETLAQILSECPPVRTEEVTLGDAGGRVLSETRLATIPLPLFDNSVMDGYAVQAADAQTGAELKVIGEQAAGLDRQLQLGSGEAIRIFTGAPIPVGADAVVMQEDCDRIGDRVRVRVGVKSGEFIRRQGEDLARGQKIGQPGQVLTAARLAVFASQGIESTKVSVRPRVALIATGSELRSGSAPLGPGEIYETNRLMLAELVRQTGAVPTSFPIVPDDRAAQAEALQRGLESDVVIISGGASVGDKDLVKAVLADLGVELRLWRVAIKPGKPFLYGRRNETLIFGLPGNPVSAYVTYFVFVRPLLFRLQGRVDFEEKRVVLTAAADVHNKGDRPHYLRVKIDGHRFWPVGRQESHALFGLAQASGLVRLDPQSSLAEGQAAEVIWLE
jgi:molybdopterin molybdotransferase